MQAIILIVFCAVLYFVVYGFKREVESVPFVPAEDWRQFEFEVAKMFEGMGFRAYVTEATQDGGKDLILYKDDEVYYVECKYYSEQKIGRPLVQKLVGAMTVDSADGGFFVTTSGFTNEALEYAKRANVTCLTVNSNAM